MLILTADFTKCQGCVALGIDANGNQVVYHMGDKLPVPPVISGEQAVIIWDAAHQTEHFIRQADIFTTQPNVGFVVPTPQTPELVEANPSIFTIVAEVAAPKVVPKIIPQTPIDTLWRIFGSFEVKPVFTTISEQLAVAASGPSDTRENSVQVISQQDVANYHATVLAADDTASLSRWLKENGYAWNKDDDAWLQPYLTAKWKITAFKLLQNPHESGSGTIQSSAIRMSFKTDRPFFPYSEPQDTPKGNAPNPSGRVLNVAVLSNERVTGKLDDGHAWPGELQYSGPIVFPQSLAQFIDASKFDHQEGPFPPPTQLTCFTDDSNPRPGTADLYFTPDADQSFFQKTVVDPYLPPEYRTDWSNPIADIEALLIFAFPIGVYALLVHLSQKPKLET